jgi:predicted O-methyltransferase YrrM
MERYRWHVLTDLVRRNNLKKGAEIGIGKGLNAMHFLKMCPQVHMIEVGIWPADYRSSDDGPAYGHKQQEKNRIRALSRLSVHHERVTTMLMESTEAARFIPDGSLDFVFIDADHSYEGCKADIIAWAPKVRRGGFVTGHDYYERYPGVIRAVDEFFPERELEDDAIWIAQV